MFNLFKKNKTCEVCGINSQTNIILGFDPTNRGQFPYFGKRENLCINHLKKKWQYVLKSFNGFSVCFLPQKTLNSYSYIILEQAGSWGIEKLEVGILNTLVDRNINQKGCEKCSNKAQFLLFNFVYDPNEVLNIENTISKNIPHLLCGDHFIERILQEIQNQNIILDEINIPYGERGLYIHGEY